LLGSHSDFFGFSCDFDAFNPMARELIEVNLPDGVDG
jgi:hypothetical protein